MKKSLFVLFVICFALGINYSKAQDSLKTFDLSRYKLPDLIRHQLDVGTAFGSNYRIQDDHNANQRENRLNLNGNINLDYWFYRNSKKYQADLGLNYYGSYGNNKYTYYYPVQYIQSQASSKSNSLNHNLDFFSSNRFYFQGLNFIEVGPEIDFEFRRSRDKTAYTNEDYRKMKNNIDRYQFQLPLFYGYGRIERVEDARQMVFLLQDLQKNGRLKKVPTGEDIIALSETASIIKNKRFFDSRIRKIEELKAMDAKLKELGLITDDDITYYTSLNDMWNYGDQFVRLSGYRFYVGAVPDYLNIKTYTFSEFHSESNNTSQEVTIDQTQTNAVNRILFTVGFEYQKPVKQKWQYWLDAGVQAGPSKINNKLNDVVWNDTTIETSLKMTDFITTVETGFGLFPNTRTYLALSASGYYNYDKGKYYVNETGQDSKNNYYEASLNLTGYYYISPKLRLNVRYNYMFSHLIGTNSIQGKYGNQVWYGSYYLPELSILEGENNDKSIYHYFNISLTYSIF